MKFFAILLAILFMFNATAADWRVTPVQDWSFDASNIETKPNGNFRVWQKFKMHPEVVKKLEESLRDNGSLVDYSSYSVSIARWELDCKKRKYGPVSGTNYAVNGQVIASYDVDDRPLDLVIPDSDGEFVFDAVCKYVQQVYKKKR